MRNNLKISFCLFYCFAVSVVFRIQNSNAQNSCNLNQLQPLADSIEINIDQRNFGKAKKFIQKIQLTDDTHQLFKLLNEAQIAAEENQLPALDSLIKKLSLKITKNTCTELQMRFYYLVSLNYIKKEQTDSALQYLFKTKDVAKQIKNNVYEAKTLGRIAYVFNTLMNEPSTSLSYSKQSIKIIEQTNRKDLLLLFELNKLAYFGRLYDHAQNTLYLDSIFEGAQTALKLARALKIPQRLGQTYSLMAGVCYGKKNYYKAIAYCDSGLKSIEYEIDFKNLHALFTKKCDSYIELKDFKNASFYADSSLIYAKKSNNTLSVKSAIERLYEIEKLKGNPDLALHYHEQLKLLDDSIYEIEKTEITNELEKKYNQVQNENKIAALSHQQEISTLRTRIIFGVSVILIVFLLLMFIYRNAQAKTKILEAEQRLNRLRMNPHFFFNALASLQSFSLKEHNQEFVASYLAKLSKIMRQSLESTFTEFISLEEEINFLENYLQVQQQLSNHYFLYEINTSDIEDCSEIKIPAMLLQPFIENSITHGFKNKDSDAFIQIVFSVKNKMLYIELSDNGIYKEPDKNNPHHLSRSIGIIKDRLFLLNKIYKSKAEFKVTVNNENKGTKVELFLPLLMAE